MKYIILAAVLIAQLCGASLKVPLVDVQKDFATIKIENIDVGVSGYIVRSFSEEHGSIIANAEVVDFNAQTKEARLRLWAFDTFANNNLPKGKWQAKIGDTAVLAQNYTRALLVAPTEEIYYRIVKSVPSLEWIHPDVFATMLSYEGHPTPLVKDFRAFGSELSVGLVYLYLNEKLFTIDLKSFVILDSIDAPLTQEREALMLPFYSRVEKIDANWFGEGSGRLEEYEPYYYEVLAKHNTNNKKLYDIIKNSDEKFHKLLKEFDIKD